MRLCNYLRTNLSLCSQISSHLLSTSSKSNLELMFDQKVRSGFLPSDFYRQVLLWLLSKKQVVKACRQFVFLRTIQEIFRGELQ